jgi:hypothetical protein
VPALSPSAKVGIMPDHPQDPGPDVSAYTRWVLRWHWAIAAVAAVVGVVVIFTTHDPLEVGMCIFAALVFAVIPPFRAQLRAKTAELRAKRGD